MQITRFPHLSEHQLLGCASAFVDSWAGELNATVLELKRLEGRAKGTAFLYEMSLDQHRYGALLVLERWEHLVQAFGGHVTFSRYSGLIEEAPQRVDAAREILNRLNHLIDGAEAYTSDVVGACVVAAQSLQATFAEEQRVAKDLGQLGPLLPDEYREARSIFLQDLAAR